MKGETSQQVMPLPFAKTDSSGSEARGALLPGLLSWE